MNVKFILLTRRAELCTINVRPSSCLWRNRKGRAEQQDAGELYHGNERTNGRISGTRKDRIRSGGHYRRNKLSHVLGDRQRCELRTFCSFLLSYSLIYNNNDNNVNNNNNNTPFMLVNTSCWLHNKLLWRIPFTKVTSTTCQTGATNDTVIGNCKH